MEMENVNKKIESLKKYKKLLITGVGFILVVIPVFFNDLNTYIACIEGVKKIV